MREFRTLIKQVEDAVKEMARREPIPLDPGYVLGKSPEDVLDAKIMAKVLTELYGPEVAEDALAREPKPTKAALSRALRKHVLKDGMKISQLERTALAAIRDAGGVTIRYSIERHKPRPPALEVVPAASQVEQPAEPGAQG